MGARIRLVTVTVAVQAVLDDGDALTPLNIDPITIPAAQWETFDLAEQIDVLQARIDTQPD